MDEQGNLYGTTTIGGSGGCTDPEGCGTVFELTPIDNGQWSEKVLYSFQGNADGAYPYCTLVIDANGNLYGTTSAGGPIAGRQYGTVFELSPNGGEWTFNVIFTFTDLYNTGAHPRAGLAMDSVGNLYGTTYSGGRTNRGTVFELQPPPVGGQWTESILSSFPNNPNEWSDQVAVPVFDSKGNIYGTLSTGGSTQDCVSSGYCGAVFEQIPNGTGGWNTAYIHQFNLNKTPKDGASPQAGVVLDSLGNVYGTTELGGQNGEGTVFRLTPAHGSWGEATYSFCTASGACPTGSKPLGSLVLDARGNVYGTTFAGGNPQNGLGAVFEILP